MSRKSVCRTCLAVNNRMYDLKTTHLQDLFEKITSIKLITEDGRNRVCYICYSTLQKCQRFICMSQDADKMFRNLAKGIETPKFGRPLNNFIVTPVDSMTVPDRALETQVIVKIEPTDIKEEITELDSGLYESVKIEGLITDDLMEVHEETLITVEESDTEIYKNEQLDVFNKNYQTEGSKKSAYNCKECNKEFSQFHSLKRHMNNHDDDTIFACNSCEETFTSKTVFQNHMRKHTKPYTCTICDKSFSELSTLRKHTASHSADKPFICGSCKKGFTHKAFLVVHLRTHTGEKPYACDLCDKTFAQIGHLISHKRSHLKIKPFPCLQCDKSFAERNTLKKHIQKLHNASKPYACKICYWTFSAKDALERHQRNHLVQTKALEEKPVCNQCGKGFSTVGNMRKHMKTHEWENSLCESQKT